MKQIKTKTVDASIFSWDYLNEISLGRLFVNYFGVLFSSRVINGLLVNPEIFIQSIKDARFNLETLGDYKVFATDDDGKEKNEYEYILLIDQNIILGLRELSLRLSYDNKKTPEDKIEKLMNIYKQLKLDKKSVGPS